MIILGIITLQNDTIHNGTRKNDAQHNDTQHFYIRYLDTQHDDAKHTQHNIKANITDSTNHLSFMLSIVFFNYCAECRHAECRSADCRGADAMTAILLSILSIKSDGENGGTRGSHCQKIRRRRKETGPI